MADQPVPARRQATALPITVVGIGLGMAMLLLFTGWLGYRLGQRSAGMGVDRSRGHNSPPSWSPMDNSKPIPLAAAVDNFNRLAQYDEIGKTQPPLTEDEVIAAIRGWAITRKSGPPVSNAVFNSYQAIANSRMLPVGARLQSCNGWNGFNGFDMDVWWIDLQLMTAPRSGYNFRIRDQKISSRPAGQKRMSR